jgi:hypothetical protein
MIGHCWYLDTVYRKMQYDIVHPRKWHVLLHFLVVHRGMIILLYHV